MCLVIVLNLMGMFTYFLAPTSRYAQFSYLLSDANVFGPVSTYPEQMSLNLHIRLFFKHYSWM